MWVNIPYMDDMGMYEVSTCLIYRSRRLFGQILSRHLKIQDAGFPPKASLPMLLLLCQMKKSNSPI